MTTNHKALIHLIKNSLGQANVLTIPRVLVDFTGSLDCALLLSQIIYWSDRGRDPSGWFYKTYAEWRDEICLSEYEVRKCVRKLVKLGFLETKVRKAPNGNPTVHHRLDWPSFSETFLEFLENENSTNSGIKPEETSETLIAEISTEPTLQRSERAPPTPVPEKSSRKGKSNGAVDPAVELYQRLTGRQLPPASRSAIAAAGIGSAEDLALWERVVQGHVLCGYRLSNVDCALDYFRRREIPKSKFTMKGKNYEQQKSKQSGKSPRLASRAELGLGPESG